MFKTDDGQLFADIKEAIAHEQRGFISAGLTPLLLRLFQAANSGIIPGDAVLIDSLVTTLAADRALIADFQKVFAKVQLTAAVTAKRKPRPSRKKKAAETPAPEAPASTDPSEKELDAIGDLAGSPIVIPDAPSDEQAPPPPQA